MQAIMNNRDRDPFLRSMAILLAVAILASSMIFLVESKGANAASKPTHYDGKTLFEGFFFGRGPVAKLFPEYYKNPSQPTDKTIAAQEELLKKVEEADPSFLRRFESSLYSGDRVRVQKALEEGASKVADALANELGVSADDIKNGKVGDQATPNDTYYYYYYVYIYEYAYFVIDLFYPADPCNYCATVPGSGQKPGLSQDRFVDTVVKRLGQSHMGQSHKRKTS